MQRKRRINLVLQDDTRNHNKFYQMTEVSRTEFQAEWGRIGNKAQVKIYPMSKWYEKYDEKLKKGYHDVSNRRITVGSVVKTEEHTLGIVTGIHDYHDNEPYEVIVFFEHKPEAVFCIHDLSLGYVNPEYFTHNLFYPRLVEKYKTLRNIE